MNEPEGSPPSRANALCLMENETPAAPRHWRRTFLEKLAETSNVTASAAAAGISPGRAYKTRRNEPDFARDWYSALLEGYEHLEMETLSRLRMGTEKDDPKFDITNALRILTVHKETVARERAKVDMRDEEAILAALDAKLEKMRSREENVIHVLKDNGVSLARSLDDDD